MDVRAYSNSDLESLVALFTASVRAIDAIFYSTEQLHAWAPQPPDLELWQERLRGLHTLLTFEDDQLAGFISYEDNGHIDLLYTAPIFQRRGVATKLLSAVDKMLPDVELFTEASLVAEPFFQLHGFHIIAEQNASLRGVTFRRYAMRRPNSLHKISS